MSELRVKRGARERRTENARHRLELRCIFRGISRLSKSFKIKYLVIHHSLPLPLTAYRSRFPRNFAIRGTCSMVVEARSAEIDHLPGIPALPTSESCRRATRPRMPCFNTRAHRKWKGIYVGIIRPLSCTFHDGGESRVQTHDFPSSYSSTLHCTSFTWDMPGSVLLVESVYKVLNTGVVSADAAVMRTSTR